MRKKLIQYRKLLNKWQKTCNLIGPTALLNIEDHFQEAKEAAKLIPQASTWLDIGSGGGLPVVVFACLYPDTHFHLVESKSRKCSFLEEIVQQLHLNATVHWARAEKLPSIKPDIISARAVASPGKTLAIALHHTAPHTKILLFQSSSQARKTQAKTSCKAGHGVAILLTKEEAQLNLNTTLNPPE